jgi:hypothetical protein
MWWQGCKMKLVMGLAVILVAFIIFILICFSGGNCITSGKQKANKIREIAAARGVVNNPASPVAKGASPSPRRR